MVKDPPHVQRPCSLPAVGYHGFMQHHNLENLARQLLQGELSLEQFVGQACAPTIAELGEAQLDLDRRRRCGFPEVVFAQGKTVAAMEKIFQTQLAHGQDVMATRMTPEQAAELLAKFRQAALQPGRANVSHSRSEGARRRTAAG